MTQAPRALSAVAFLFACWAGWTTGKVLSARVEAAAPSPSQSVTASASLVPTSGNEDSLRYSLGDAGILPKPGSVFDSAEWVREDGLMAAERPPLDENVGAVVRHFYSKSFGKHFELDTVAVSAHLARPGTFFEVGFSADKKGTHFIRAENRSIELLYALAGNDERVVLRRASSGSGLEGKEIRLIFGSGEAKVSVGGEELAVFPVEEARHGAVSVATNLRSSELESFAIAGSVNGSPVEDSFR